MCQVGVEQQRVDVDEQWVAVVLLAVAEADRPVEDRAGVAERQAKAVALAVRGSVEAVGECRRRIVALVERDVGEEEQVRVELPPRPHRLLIEREVAIGVALGHAGDDVVAVARIDDVAAHLHAEAVEALVACEARAVDDDVGARADRGGVDRRAALLRQLVRDVRLDVAEARDVDA